MKQILALIMGLALVMSLLTFAGDEGKNQNEANPNEANPPKKELKTDFEKLSYAFGLNTGFSLKQENPEIDLALFIQGVEDSFNGKKLLGSREEMMRVLREFDEKKQNESKSLGDKNKKDGEAFLKENKKNKDVTTTSSGLQYSIIKKGTGPKPKATDKVKVNYRGTLIDGTEFDSSYKRGQPAVFPVNKVIAGWTEALQLMNVGSTYRLFIPSNLAYGERGQGGIIGPNAVLIFEVELLSIEK